jgi:mitogen-activated protein kinase 15
LKAVHKATTDLEIYLVFNLMQSDLRCVIRSNILMEVHKRYISWQLAFVMRHLHARHLIHRDLKPANLLVNADSCIKVCDFGFARTLADNGQTKNILTEYVSTRWYRAPELVAGSENYDEGVDLWAIGCIVAELYLGRPLFPGNSTLNQMELIVAYTGMPSSEDIASMHTEYAGTILAQLSPNIQRTTLEQMIPEADTETLDFIKRFLTWNPSRRMTADEALSHPFLKEFALREDPTINLGELKARLTDEERFTVNDYRKYIYKNFISV